MNEYSVNNNNNSRYYILQSRIVSFSLTYVYILHLKVNSKVQKVQNWVDDIVFLLITNNE